jgi:hypothetical protein
VLTVQSGPWTLRALTVALETTETTCDLNIYVTDSAGAPLPVAFAFGVGQWQCDPTGGNCTPPPLPKNVVLDVSPSCPPGTYDARLVVMCSARASAQAPFTLIVTP